MGHLFEDEYMFALPAILPTLVYWLGAMDHQYRAPALTDYTKMYGIITRSIALVSTSGYFGGAMVRTLDQLTLIRNAWRHELLVTAYTVAVWTAICHGELMRVMAQM